MERNKVAVAGNMVVDVLYKVDKYPNSGELAVMDDDIQKALGGAGCNNTLDFARLDKNLPVIAMGRIGDDENGSFIIDTFKSYSNIDTQHIKRSGSTSFTAVMNCNHSKQRTFFQFKGANADFSPDDIDLAQLKDVKLLHIGYLLLLDQFDKPDDLYGTKMARFLAQAQEYGIETSIDAVSSSKGKFKEIIVPSLKYTDYCIVNELEAQQITGVQLRFEEKLLTENFEQALKKLKKLGVGKWAVIHAPEFVYGLDCTTGSIIIEKCLRLSNDFIKGTTGAGDALCTGILYGAYRQKDLSEAIRWGIASAVSSLSEVNAYDGVKSIDECLNLYEKLDCK